MCLKSSFVLHYRCVYVCVCVSRRTNITTRIWNAFKNQAKDSDKKRTVKKYKMYGEERNVIIIK